MRTPIFSLLAMRGPALSPVKQNLFALLLVLAVVLCGGQARAEIDINVLSGNRLYDVLDLNPPPSEVDGHVRIWPHGASVLGSSETFSLREPGEYHFHSQSLVLKTLTVTDIVVAFYGYDMITDGVYSSPVLLSLCNTTYATTSFVVGDSTNDGYTELNLEFGMHIQSFGFAYIGLPVIPGELAEGILKIGNDSSWSHVGLITIGQGNGAGRLEIKGEVSGGLSGDHPNIFVGRNQISRGGWYESAAQLDVSGGTVFANELVVEGRAIGTGDVHASLVRVQNGGFAGFSNGSASSTSLAIICPSLIISGEPNDLPTRTLCPVGPSVIFIRSARLLAPLSIFCRPWSSNINCLDMFVSLSVDTEEPRN